MNKVYKIQTYSQGDIITLGEYIRCRNPDEKPVKHRIRKQIYYPR